MNQWCDLLEYCYSEKEKQELYDTAVEQAKNYITTKIEGMIFRNRDIDDFDNDITYLAFSDNVATIEISIPSLRDILDATLENKKFENDETMTSYFNDYIKTDNAIKSFVRFTSLYLMCPLDNVGIIKAFKILDTLEELNGLDKRCQLVGNGDAKLADDGLTFEQTRTMLRNTAAMRGE